MSNTHDGLDFILRHSALAFGFRIAMAQDEDPQQLLRAREKARSALQFFPMMTREGQITLWTSTYNAALTGLLVSKMHQLGRFSANNVGVITEQCKAFADQAVKDVAEYDRDMPIP